MPEFALPCIACGKELHNEGWLGAVGSSDVTNQPSDGTAFWTTGHYGSTFFDPMDGSQLEINVCDECLGAHVDRILWQQASQRLTCAGVTVGSEDMRRWREQVSYDPAVHDYDKGREVEPDELGQPRDGVTWAYSQFDLARQAYAADLPVPEETQ